MLLNPKPTAAEILEAGRQAGESVAVILARFQAGMDGEIQAYLTWLGDCVSAQRALIREMAMGARDGAGDSEGSRPIDAPQPEPRYERYRLAYPSGTVVEAFYAGGAPLEEVRVTHPMAVVEAVADSLVDAKATP